MNYPKYKETIGVNEDVKKPPYPENVNDLEKMYGQQGRVLGQSGDQPRSWFILLALYLILGGPVFIYSFSYISLGYGNLELWMRLLLAPFLLVLVIITHIPLIKGILCKFNSCHSSKRWNH